MRTSLLGFSFKATTFHSYKLRVYRLANDIDPTSHWMFLLGEEGQYFRFRVRDPVLGELGTYSDVDAGWLVSPFKSDLSAGGRMDICRMPALSWFCSENGFSMFASAS